MHSGANLLLLDEPTNHLDITSREALESALLGFAGTILFASHDRRLISRLATRLWLVEDGALTQFAGSLEELERAEAAVQQEAARPPVAQKQSPAQVGRSPRRRAEAIAALEAQIEAQEIALTELGEEINQASAGGEITLLAELGRRFETLQADLNDLMHRWLEIS